MAKRSVCDQFRPTGQPEFPATHFSEIRVYGLWPMRVLGTENGLSKGLTGIPKGTVHPAPEIRNSWKGSRPDRQTGASDARQKTLRWPYELG